MSEELEAPSASSADGPVLVGTWWSRRAGEDDFTVFFGHHVRQLRAVFAGRMSAAQVDDLVGATMVVAWRRFDEIPGEAALGWLCGVGFRLARNQARSGRRYDRLVDDVLADAVCHASSAQLDTTHLLAEQREPLIEALADLDAADRELLWLVAAGELSGQELASELGVSEVAARKRLSRARRRLRTHYARRNGCELPAK